MGDEPLIPPEVTIQMLSDAGLNPFAVKLLIESYLRFTREPKPVSFRLWGVAFSMELVEPEEIPEELKGEIVRKLEG